MFSWTDRASVGHQMSGSLFQDLSTTQTGFLKLHGRKSCCNDRPYREYPKSFLRKLPCNSPSFGVSLNLMWPSHRQGGLLDQEYALIGSRCYGRVSRGQCSESHRWVLCRRPNACCWDREMFCPALIVAIDLQHVSVHPSHFFLHDASQASLVLVLSTSYRRPLLHLRPEFFNFRNRGRKIAKL